MKGKMQKRIISFVMTILMTLSLLPVNFLGGEVIRVQADTLVTENITWNLKGATSAQVFEGNAGYSTEFPELYIDGTNGKLSIRIGNWAQMNNRAKLSFQVSRSCTVAVTAYDTNFQCTINGENKTGPSFEYEYEYSSDGTIEIESSADSYIGSISVTFPPEAVDKTWDFTTSFTETYQSGGTATGTYDGLGIDASASGSKLTPNNPPNSNSAQFTTGAKISVPVAGNCTITVEAYQAQYALYKINGEAADTNNAVTVYGYTGEAGSVDIVSTGNAYIKTISVTYPTVSATKATVTGTVGTSVAGEKLVIKKDGTQVTTATIAGDGSYSVELEVGNSYTVEFKKSALYEITSGGTIDLTGTAAGASVTNNITYNQNDPRLTLDAPAITYSFTSSVFGSNGAIEPDTMSPDGILTLNGTNMSWHDTTHGLTAGNGAEFAITVPAGQTTVTVATCKYSGGQAAGKVFASLYINGVKKSDDVDLYDATDGTEKTLVCTTDAPATVVLKVEGTSSGYIHYLTAKAETVQPTATVSGTIDAAVNGQKLLFKKSGSTVADATVANGTYSVALPVGSEYTVEFENSGIYKVSEGGTIDLTATTAGTTVTNNITYVAWDATKTATVTVGGTTFTIQPGASDTAVFSVTASGGDGSVEYAGAKEAILWANLGGAGNGVVSNVIYGNGATASVSGNTITVTFAGNTLPESYKLNVKDNSASGVPVQDGATKVYSMTDGSVISKLYDSNNALTGATTITSTDKLVSLTANNKIYYHGSHGIVIADTDVVTVKVAGNATVSFSLCQHSQPSEMLTASAPTGRIYLSTDDAQSSTPIKVSSDGGTATFVYEGTATTLTFTLTGGVSGQNYIHSITVTNEAEATTTNEDAVRVKPQILTGVGVAGNLTVTPNGQKLNFVQTGGQLPSNMDSTFAEAGVSFYAFPETADWNKLELEVTVNSIEQSSDKNGIFVGAINGNVANTAVATVGVRKLTGLRGIYTKAAEYAGGGQANSTITAGDTVKYTVYKADDAFYIESVWSEGTYTSKFNYNDTSFVAFRDNGSATPVYYGLMLAGVNADVKNMVYYDKDGNVLYDQNKYYNPIGTAPVASSVSATAAADRTYIDVTWTGSQVYGDGKYVLQVSKDGGAWTEVSDKLTGYSYQYPVSSDASGTYKFRVCGTLGNSAEQSAANRNSYVESGDVVIIAALEAPVLTLNVVSPADKVNLSWTVSPLATTYEVYRRSADEATATLIATVTGTSYTDTAVTAEVPYYYYVIAKSADNFSNPQKEVWTLPTAGHTGEYQYEDAVIAITKKSYDTVFKDKITIEGLVTAPGVVSVEVNGTVAATTTVSEANGTFSFADITVAEGRNDVVVYLKYDGGNKITRKPLNIVYLTNYDYVVDGTFTGTPGDTSTYGVPEYATIGEAITAVGAGNTSRKVIFIKEGSYEERLDITTPYISLIGEDSTKTIIHCYPGDAKWGLAGGSVLNSSTSDRCAMRVEAAATGFSAENLTIQNDWEYKGDGSISNESADAIMSEAEGAMYVNVRFMGYQDTIDANKNHQYYYKCYITGNVDFIYGGNGMALFNDCDIVFRYNANKNSGYVTAMKSDSSIAYGVVFNECRITAENGCSGTKYYLGRPWGEEAAVTYIDCYMSSIINRNVGFTTWGGKDFSTDEAAFAKTRYYENGSYGGGYAVTKYRRQISDTQAATMLSPAGLGWDPYSNTATVSSSYYVGNKTTASDDKFVNDTYNSDKYSAYEGNDTGLGKYNLEGYAQSSATTGGGLLKETNSNYYAVSTAEEFLDALVAIKAKGTAAVIEIKSDLSLGNLEVQNFASYSSIAQAHTNVPLTHPELVQSGVSSIKLKEFSDLTIFSSNGSSINHASFDIQGSNNIIIRNIAFDELWEWDEATSGDYDRNDWDYIVIQNGCDRIWIDHCTFYKAYDGVVDIKTNTTANNTNVTVSWCEFLPGSENNTFFNAMMDTLAANPAKYPYYKSLLDSGMTEEQIWWYAYGQKKTHLLGQSDEATQNEALRVTFANNYYYDSMDRMPRLRYGNAHVYNCIMDAQELYDARNSISNAEAAKHIVSNGASSTCGGQLLVENSYINGIINALNSGNGSSPAGYINAVNSLYYIDGTRYALTPKVNTTKPGEKVLLLDADNFVENLPYSGYALYDAAELYTVVKPYAGAGKLNLTVLQWEKGAYKDSTWVVPDDDSDYGNENLPDYVETENGIAVIGENIAIEVPKDVVFKNSKGEVIEDGKIFVKAVIDENSPLAGKIKIGSDENILYYDVTCVDENGDKVTIASGKLTLIFKYPEGTNKSDYSFKVYHGLADGQIEQLGTSRIDTGIMVKVSSLSPFAIRYALEEEDEYDGDTVDSVSTGDTTPVVPLAVIMFVSAGVCASFFFRKRKRV
ncbi:MAG: pectinesterase family protein [Thermoflexaceae bacterium]|nr:pectinesterase family protein [Thermoflexaceae bacterium]